MGRSPCCCHDAGVKKGPWTEEEDRALVEHIQKHGGHIGSWRRLPKAAGLHRCSKSCRLRWTNYLRPDIKRGNFSDDEERLIIRLHSVLGNKWSTIATHLEGRTDNEIKNYWNTHIRKKLLRMGVDPVTHQQLPPDHHHLDVGALATSPALPEALLWAAVASLSGLDSGLRQVQLLQQLLQLIGSGSSNDGSAADLIANLAAANAVVNLSSIVPNLPDQMNMLSPASYQPGYLCNISNFAEQDVVKQLINATAPGVSSYAAANAVVNSSSIVPNLQDQMNMLSPANYQPGYLCNISNFAEQDVVQQLINATAPEVSSYAAAAAEPADQHCNTAAAAAAAFVSAAAYPRDVAAAVDRPVQEFAGLLEPMELPSLCSLESDSFWKDILEDSYRL